MAKFLFDEKHLDVSDLNFDEPMDTQEIVDAVKELNRSVTFINRALVKLQQKIADKQAELETEALQEAQYIH